MSNSNNIPPHIPSSSVPIARELGILFGFLIASLVIMAVYAVIWRAIERRDQERDRLRKEKLVAKGVHHGRGGLHEKMLDREGGLGRVELPAGGNGVGDGDRNGSGKLGKEAPRSRGQNGYREAMNGGGRNGRLGGLERDW